MWYMLEKRQMALLMGGNHEKKGEKVVKKANLIRIK